MFPVSIRASVMGDPSEHLLTMRLQTSLTTSTNMPTPWNLTFKASGLQTVGGAVTLDRLNLTCLV